VGLLPQYLENLEFYQYNCLKWLVTSVILTKFIGFCQFMHVITLHNSAKFSYFSLINNKTKQFTLVGVLSDKFLMTP